MEVPTKAQIGKQTSGGCSIKPPLERSSTKLVHITAILLSNVHQLKCSSLKYMNYPPFSSPPFDPLNWVDTNDFTVCRLLLLYNKTVTVAFIYSNSVMQLWSIRTLSACASPLDVAQSLITTAMKEHHYLSSLCASTRIRKISCCSGLGMVCEDVVDSLL